MEKKDIRKAIVLANVLKGVYRQIILATTIGAIFFSLYISMHQQSTASSLSQYQYWILFTIFWMSLFIFAIGVVKGEQFTRFFVLLSLMILLVFCIYDSYMLTLFYGVNHHTYLVTTLVFRWTFWVLEVFLIATLIFSLLYDQKVWVTYVSMVKYYDAYDLFDRYNFKTFSNDDDDNDEGEDDEEEEGKGKGKGKGKGEELDREKIQKRIEKIVKQELKGSYHRSKLKDDIILGVIYIILPFETSALYFYILTIVSVDNATFSDWLYIFHVLTIVASAVWYSTDSNNIPRLSSRRTARSW